jgi:Virulence factor BrkB
MLAGIVALALAIVYRYAPDRAEPKWQWISWGSIAAIALWILGSLAFTTYVSKVGSYDKTYCSLGAVIILLLWFYLTAYVILAWAELNAEIERQTTRPVHHARSIHNGSDSGARRGAPPQASLIAAVRGVDSNQLRPWLLRRQQMRILISLKFRDEASALRSGRRHSRTVRRLHSIAPVHQCPERCATA